MSDRADSAQFKVAGLTDGRYLPFKGESLIKEDDKLRTVLEVEMMVPPS